MHLKENIASLRKREGLTQAKLAEELNVSAATVSKWETGAAVPDLPMLWLLADRFRLTLDELVGRTPNRFTTVLFCYDGGKGRETALKLLSRHGFAVKGTAETVSQLEELFTRVDRVDFVYTVGCKSIDKCAYAAMSRLKEQGKFNAWNGTASSEGEESLNELLGFTIPRLYRTISEQDE